MQYKILLFLILQHTYITTSLRESDNINFFNNYADVDDNAQYITILDTNKNHTSFIGLPKKTFQESTQQLQEFRQLLITSYIALSRNHNPSLAEIGSLVEKLYTFKISPINKQLNDNESNRIQTWNKNLNELRQLYWENSLASYIPCCCCIWNLFLRDQEEERRIIKKAYDFLMKDLPLQRNFIKNRIKENPAIVKSIIEDNQACWQQNQNTSDLDRYEVFRQYFIQKQKLK